MSDYMFALESHLDAGQTRIVTEVQRLATAAGMNVWLTGGAMRDMLRGAPIRDLDFTIEKDAVRIGKSLAEAVGGRVVEEDSLKRSVELEFADGIRASLANARTEKYSKPGGKPQISPATIHEDLARRDLTFNAIALALNRGTRGLIVDPTNGQADLMNRELRLTNSYALFDDPSRIVRLLRFRHSLGFEMTARTQAQLENAIGGDYGAGISGGAITQELRAMAAESSAGAFLEDLDARHLLKPVSPALTGAKLNVAGLSRFEKLISSVLPPAQTDCWVAFLSVLLEKLTPRERTDAIRNLELRKAELEELKTLEARAKKLESTLKSPKIRRPSQVWLALEGATTDEVLTVLYQSAARVVQDRIRAFYQKYLPQAQEITEAEVAATGARPGTPKFDKTWKGLVAQRLNSRPRKVVAPPEPEPAPLSAPIVMSSRARR
jgi:tRNA nucleotidyltransferase (CCA-adding enzyme)